MSAHALLNLLNMLGKRDKMRSLPSILSLFGNKFNKFNNTRARMLDSIYHMTLRLLLNLISAVKKVIILSLCMQHCYGRHNVSQQSINHLVVYRFYCTALFHSQMRRHMIISSVHLKVFYLYNRLNIAQTL